MKLLHIGSGTQKNRDTHIHKLLSSTVQIVAKLEFIRLLHGGKVDEQREHGNSIATDGNYFRISDTSITVPITSDVAWESFTTNIAIVV